MKELPDVVTYPNLTFPAHRAPFAWLPAEHHVHDYRRAAPSSVGLINQVTNRLGPWCSACVGGTGCSSQSQLDATVVSESGKVRCPVQLVESSRRSSRRTKDWMWSVSKRKVDMSSHSSWFAACRIRCDKTDLPMQEGIRSTGQPDFT